MIIFQEPCPECGQMPLPVDVACDKCGKLQKIEEFTGIIVHFEVDDYEDLCDECSEECEKESGEYQFCDCKCLSEYIADPNSDGFDKYEDCSVNIITDSTNLSQLLYAIGRYNF